MQGSQLCLASAPARPAVLRPLRRPRPPPRLATPRSVFPGLRAFSTGVAGLRSSPAGLVRKGPQGGRPVAWLALRQAPPGTGTKFQEEMGRNSQGGH